MNFCIAKRDMIIAAKKHDMFTARIAFGVIVLILLFIFWLMARALNLEEVEAREFTEIIRSSLFVIYYSELGLITLLIIGITSSIVPKERERKTLHFLMATPMSGLEIIINILLAAIARLTIIILIGLPFFVLLCSLGGIRPLTILLCHIQLLTSMWITGSLALFVSVGSKRTITAILLIFLIGYFSTLLTFIIHDYYRSSKYQYKSKLKSTSLGSSMLKRS